MSKNKTEKPVKQEPTKEPTKELAPPKVRWINLEETPKPKNKK